MAVELAMELEYVNSIVHQDFVEIRAIYVAGL